MLVFVSLFVLVWLVFGVRSASAKLIPVRIYYKSCDQKQYFVIAVFIWLKYLMLWLMLSCLGVITHACMKRQTLWGEYEAQIDYGYTTSRVSLRKGIPGWRFFRSIKG